MLELPPLSVPSIPHIDVSSFVSIPVLSIILGLFFIFYAIVSAVLMYHWSEYGMRSFTVILAEGIFVVVSLALFVVCGLGLHYF
jgi:hypothetical protein